MSCSMTALCLVLAFPWEMQILLHCGQGKSPSYQFLRRGLNAGNNCRFCRRPNAVALVYCIGEQFRVYFETRLVWHNRQVLPQYF